MLNRRPWERHTENTRVFARPWHNYRGSAKFRGIKFSLRFENFCQLMSAPCHYCKKPKAWGIDRKDSRFAYQIGNVVPCCKPCNTAKSIKPYDQFLNRGPKCIKCQRPVDKTLYRRFCSIRCKLGKWPGRARLRHGVLIDLLRMGYRGQSLRSFETYPPSDPLGLPSALLQGSPQSCRFRHDPLYTQLPAPPVNPWLYQEQRCVQAQLSAVFVSLICIVILDGYKFYKPLCRFYTGV